MDEESVLDVPFYRTIVRMDEYGYDPIAVAGVALDWCERGGSYSGNVTIEVESDGALWEVTIRRKS